MVTRSPRAMSNMPRLDAVRPLPSEDATPPVTNRWVVACDAKEGLPVVRGMRSVLAGPRDSRLSVRAGQLAVGGRDLPGGLVLVRPTRRHRSRPRRQFGAPAGIVEQGCDLAGDGGAVAGG